ncbi:MAG: Spy/CpxP family protein refolding chaperone, partial [Armatimonadota bacterium]
RKPMAGARHHSFAKHKASYWQQLDLTEDQKAKIQEIRKSTHEQLKALKADTSLTPEAKKTKAREIIEAQRSQILGVLTPEQQKKLEQNAKMKYSSPKKLAGSKQST